jgi:hypothetical protein
MPMDERLAEIYHTNQDEGDVEKLAQAELAEKLAADGEIDPAAMSDEEAEELAKQVLADEDGDDQAAVEEPEEEEPAKAAQGEEEEEGQEKVSEAKEKLAEADYLGRVMAHAYAQELRNIGAAEQEKTAGRFEAIKGGAKEVGGKVGAHLKAHGKKYSAGAAGAAGFAAGRMSKKKQSSAEEPSASALDVLAERRALEILKANGIDPTADQKEPEQEKVSASDEQRAKLEAAVEQRATEMLETAGYQFKDEQTEESK